MEITFASNQEWGSSFLLEDGFLNQTSKQIGAFSCQRKLTMLFLSQSLNLFNGITWENTQTLNGRTLTHNNKDETKAMEGNKRCSSVVSTKVAEGISARGCNWEAVWAFFSRFPTTVCSEVTAETRHHVFSFPHCQHAQPWAHVNQRHQPFVLSFDCIISISTSGSLLLSLYCECSIISCLLFVCCCISENYYFLSSFFLLTFYLLLSLPLLLLFFFSYYWTAFTNRSCKYCQTLFLQHLPVRVMVNGFTVSGGLLTLCSLLTCCRWWPVECPAEPGMWRPFRRKAARIREASPNAGTTNILKANLQVTVWIKAT